MRPVAVAAVAFLRIHVRVSLVLQEQCRLDVLQNGLCHHVRVVVLEHMLSSSSTQSHGSKTKFKTKNKK